MPQVALDQATIDYRVFGPEDSPHPPVLFVHGILVDSRLWDRVAEGLARQGFRCYLPNWPLGSHTIPANDLGARADLAPVSAADYPSAKALMEAVRARIDAALAAPI